jgi:hypothetical protein
MDKDEGALKLVQTTHQHHSTISQATLDHLDAEMSVSPFFYEHISGNVALLPSAGDGR